MSRPEATPAPPAGPPEAGTPILGVLGGMGPLATTDFLRKLAISTPASCDQDHIPVITICDPRIPDRSAALLSGNEQPVVEALREGIARLAAAGATGIVMPCNTAHHWFEELERSSSLPMIHIADAAVRRLCDDVPAGRQIALLATPGTLRSGFYARRLRRAGYEPLAAEDGVNEAVHSAICAIKKGNRAQAEHQLDWVIDRLFDADAAAILLACTELPLAVSPRHAGDKRVIDVTQALVDACISWSRAGTPARPHGPRA